MYAFGRSLAGHPFFAGSMIMILGNNFANVIAYFYHLIFGRMLGPSNYGDLVAFLSVAGLMTIAFSFMGMVIVKYASSLKEEEGIAFFNWLNKRSFITGAVGALLLLIVSPYIASFLHLENKLVMFLSPLFFFYLVAFVYRSYLQGKLRFLEFVLSVNVDMGGRLLIGFILIFLGYSVLGAVVGNVLAAFFAFCLLYLFVRRYLKIKNNAQFTQKREMFKYSIPVFFSAISSYMLITSDVLIVKHTFSAHDAGLYAALSTLGKVIFYATGPINGVMFPLVAKRHSQGYGYKKIIFYSILLTLLVGVGVTSIFYLLPERMITILYGSEFVSASPYLYLMGIFLSIFAVASLLLNYFMSINKTKVVYFSVAIAIGHLIAIYLYHESFIQVIKISILAVSLLLGILLLFLGYDQKK